MDRALEKLAALHAEIDRAAQEVEAGLGDGLQCRIGCNDCCVDGITVFEVEAALIMRRHGEVLSDSRPHPGGACAFLDNEGGCRIYESRPYVCRTQGLPLSWFEEKPAEGWVEMRDICPLNAERIPPETLDQEQCWVIGPFEARLAEIQYGQGKSGMRRIPLRELFLEG